MSSVPSRPGHPGRKSASDDRGDAVPGARAAGAGVHATSLPSAACETSAATGAQTSVTQDAGGQTQRLGRPTARTTGGRDLERDAGKKSVYQ